MPQQAVRFPDDLHSAIKAEADRRGKPHTFSSVLIEWAGVGRKAADERQLYEILREAPDWEAPDGDALESVPGATAGQDGEGPTASVDTPPSAAGSLPPAPAPIRAHPTPLVPTPDVAHGLRSNGHLPTCKCWRCEKLSGAGGPVPKLDGAA